jgi:hypothetical protein
MKDEPREPAAPPAPPSDKTTPLPAPNSTEATAPNPLTPDEQMALFEQELKETDWGHQPC